MPDHTPPTRLFPAPEDLAPIPDDQIPAVLVQLGALQSQLAARLLAAGNRPAPESPISPPAERLLSVREAAGRLSTPKAFVYELIRRAILPAVKLSPRNTRVREADLIAYLKMRKALDNKIYAAYSSIHEGSGTAANSKAAGPHSKTDGPIDRRRLEQRGALGAG